MAGRLRRDPHQRGARGAPARYVPPAAVWLAVIVAAVARIVALRSADSCGFSAALRRPDQRRSRTVAVHLGRAEARGGNAASLELVSDIFAGAGNDPIMLQSVMDRVTAGCAAWGGEARLAECAAEILEGHP